MADSLFLNLWYRDISADELLVHTLSVLRQFPYSTQQPGIGYVAVHPVSWNEATVLEQRFRPGALPEEAIALASGFLHDDYAYVFETYWDLWSPPQDPGAWVLQPAPVKVIARGEDFAEGEAEQDGQIQVDFGFDIPFLHEEERLTPELGGRVRDNVQKLVEFTRHVETTSGAGTRLLWSESDENLAQKLIARLQKVQ